MHTLFAYLLNTINVNLTLIEFKHRFFDPHVAQLSFFFQAKVIFFRVLKFVAEVDIVDVVVLGSLDLNLHLTIVFLIKGIQRLDDLL